MICRVSWTMFAGLFIFAGCGLWENKKTPDPPPKQNDSGSKYDQIKHPSYADRIGIASVKNLALAGPASSPKIAQYLIDPNPKVRESAVCALASFGKQADAAVPRIVEFTAHIDPDIRFLAVKALAYIGSQNVVRILDRARKDQDPTVRIWAHAGLAKLEGNCPRHMIEVAEVLQNDKIKDPTQATEAMTWMGCADEEVIESLTDTLDHEDFRHRAAAAQVIGTIGPRAHTAVSALTKCLSDDSHEVRSQALLGLAGLENRASEAIPVVVPMLTDPSPRIREFAAYTLGRMGLAARSAVHALQTATRDPQANVQAAAKRALSAIQNNPSPLQPEDQP